MQPVDHISTVSAWRDSDVNRHCDSQHSFLELSSYSLCAACHNHGRFNSIGNSREHGEGCVTKSEAKCLNSSGRLSFPRSPAKPVLTFDYTYYSSARCILSKETPRISQRNDTLTHNFQKLTSICCKFSRAEEHVSKYCYVMLDMLQNTAKHAFGNPRLCSPCSTF